MRKTSSNFHTINSPNGLSGESFINDPKRFQRNISTALIESLPANSLFQNDVKNNKTVSAVMMLFTKADKNGEISLILNKRSENVRQPGDLCFPGGSVSKRIDTIMARFLPFWTLKAWDEWSTWQEKRPFETEALSLLLASGLREALEEMRLLPFNVRFLGPLSPERLIMFKKVIYPFAGWVRTQKRFFPNWEVEEILQVPVSELLDGNNYGVYRLEIEREGRIDTGDFDCFVYRDGGVSEILWGATYRITVRFLLSVFGFTPPPLNGRPVIKGRLDRRYTRK